MWARYRYYCYCYILRVNHNRQDIFCGLSVNTRYEDNAAQITSYYLGTQPGNKRSNCFYSNSSYRPYVSFEMRKVSLTRSWYWLLVLSKWNFNRNGNLKLLFSTAKSLGMNTNCNTDPQICPHSRLNEYWYRTCLSSISFISFIVHRRIINRYILVKLKVW